VPHPHPPAAPASRATGSPEAGAAGVPASYAAAFYDRDPRLVARELLGAVLECRTPEGTAGGRVVETEAYLGPHDPACHAVAGRTRRTWHLHGPPGVAYVYRIYGMYWCVNAVTLPEGVGSAVLVRALEPLAGIPLQRARRGHPRRDADLASGPGKLCVALGITGALDGTPLDAGPLTLRPGPPVADADVMVTPRIGITRAADWPLRYVVGASPHASRTPRAFFRRPYIPGVDDL
jgi:DNA-3-methyladenine glycosylase